MVGATAEARGGLEQKGGGGRGELGGCDYRGGVGAEWGS